MHRHWKGVKNYLNQRKIQKNQLLHSNCYYKYAVTVGSINNSNRKISQIKIVWCVYIFGAPIESEGPGILNSWKARAPRRLDNKQVQSLYRPTARFYKFTLISLNFSICSDIIHYVRQFFFSVLINFTLAII